MTAFTSATRSALRQAAVSTTFPAQAKKVSCKFGIYMNFPYLCAVLRKSIGM